MIVYIIYDMTLYSTVGQDKTRQDKTRQDIHTQLCIIYWERHHHIKHQGQLNDWKDESMTVVDQEKTCLLPETFFLHLDSDFSMY